MRRPRPHTGPVPFSRRALHYLLDEWTPLAPSLIFGKGASRRVRAFLFAAPPPLRRRRRGECLDEASGGRGASRPYGLLRSKSLTYSATSRLLGRLVEVVGSSWRTRGPSAAVDAYSRLLSSPRRSGAVGNPSTLLVAQQEVASSSRRRLAQAGEVSARARSQAGIVRQVLACFPRSPWTRPPPSGWCATRRLARLPILLARQPCSYSRDFEYLPSPLSAHMRGCLTIG